ncbi:NUDIX hydrolase, partial [Halobium palmae]
SPSATDDGHRPLGGPVDADEHGVDALRRIFREALEVELRGVSELGTFETVHDREEERRREVVRVYGGSFVQRWPYRLDSFAGYDPAADAEYDCRWMALSAFVDGDEVLRPGGLAGRL